MRLTKTLGIAGALILSAVLGGTLIGSALATTDEDTGGAVTDSDTSYCETFLDELAAELGTTRDALTDAGRAAALATVEAAVAAGDLSEDRAADVRERIEEADGDGCGPFGHGFGPGFGPGFAHGFVRGEARGLLGGDVFEAAADALGMASADLIGELRDAGSLEALADAQGASYDEVKAAILAAVQADLDAAVEEGLSQERADAVIERLTAWLDEGGEVGAFRPGPGWRHDFGGGHLHGPWGTNEVDIDEEESEDAGA